MNLDASLQPASSKPQNASLKSALAAALIGGCVFAQSIGFDFAFDDKPRLLNNPEIRDVSNIPQYFLHPGWPGDLYRPLESVGFALTHTLFGYNPIPYHLTNVLLHAAVCLVLVLALGAVFSTRISLLAGVLFAVHAAHVEAVANVSYRTELLASLGGFLSLYLAAHAARADDASKARARRLAQGVVLFAALLCKESAGTFALIAPVYALFLPPAARFGSKPGLRDAVLATAPALAATVLYFSIRAAVFGSLFSLNPPSAYYNVLAPLAAPERAINGFVLLGKYLRLCLLPFPLHAIYGYAQIGPISSWAEGRVLSDFALAAAAAGATAWMLIKRNPLALAGWIFFASFALTSNILFPIGTVFADRLVYAGSAGFCLAVAAAADWTIRNRARFSGAAWLLFGLYTACHTGISLYEAQFWRDDWTRFHREAAVSPASSLARTNHGYQLFLLGRHREAIQEYDIALRIVSNNKQARRGLVYAYQALGDKAGARTAVRAALAFEPQNDVMLAIFAQMLLEDGDAAQAKAAAQRALAVNPENVDAEKLLAQLGGG